MIPTNHYSVSSSMPLHLDEDQSYQLFSTNYEASSATSSDLLYHQASSSNSSLLNPKLLQPGQGSYHQEPNHLGSDEEAEKIIPSSGSWDHLGVESRSKLKVKVVWKKEEGNENVEAEDGSVKWMSPKMRIMHRMAVSDQTGSDIEALSKQKFELQKQQLSLIGNDNSTNSSTHSNTTVRFCSSNFKHMFEEQKQPFSLLGTSDNSGSNNSSNNNNITVRVCSDCHTTKTPLWRSGPRGPKTLCNACGIRQRKARRAMAAAAASAAASADGTILTAEPTHVKGKNLQGKEKKSKIKLTPQKKKKSKLGCKPCIGRKKFSFEDLAISLSKNLALQQVFPQDEKEAAIMLMALSYGLLHGFPSDRYLD
ncbi:hypothetical protein Lal_00003665 [Lupinus albus]|uniref:Putative transcription factor C2C2-GATA family n=1 Tax=Lupinus albus TaxID=3870 RepID=A0A6A4Q3E9_LUPAL|nr:putative transcription factor C2C2-GATA family [Lupinus albus]KAF1870459.1 hypothetical protein Lal_00003665 [Lupinus albus]